MTKIYNKRQNQGRRRQLRKNMPKSEIILWSKLKNRQIQGERFLRQYSVDQYVIDFFCPRLKLAIEVDGDSHALLSVEEKDKLRQEYIESFGIRFLRFSNVDVYKNLDNVCQVIFDNIEKSDVRSPKARRGALA